MWYSFLTKDVSPLLLWCFFRYGVGIVELNRIFSRFLNAAVVLRFHFFGNAFFLMERQLSILDILSDKSHGTLIIFPPLKNLSLELVGGKKKVAQFLLPSLTSVAVIQTLFDAWRIPIYRKKGVAPWRAAFSFRKGKKKFA